MNTRTLDRLTIGIAVLVICLTLFALYRNPFPAVGSVTVGNEYNSTTTHSGHVLNVRTLKLGGGALGSVVITGDNTGLISLYNATTTNVNLRTGQTATSSILIADFPASAPEGTYTFDTFFTEGLILVTSGAEATSTVLWR